VKLKGAVLIAIAQEMHKRACEPYRVPRLRGVAYPFGTPHDMPPHEWRVAWDVMQALTEVAPPSVGPNPKTSEGATKLLFGWPVVRIDDAKPGFIELSAVGSAVGEPESGGDERIRTAE
jgi:hypothetical protein